MVLRFIKAREPLTKYVGSNSPWVGGKNGEKVGGVVLMECFPRVVRPLGDSQHYLKTFLIVTAWGVGGRGEGQRPLLVSRGQHSC